MHIDERQLSDFLLDSGLLSRSVLVDARTRANERNETLYHTLLNGGFVGSDHLRRAAAHTLGVPFVILAPGDISLEALVHIPEPVSRTHNVVAFRTDGNVLEVALLDLDDLSAVEFLQHTTPYKVVPRLTDQHSIKHALITYQKHLKEKFGSFAQHGLHTLETLIKHAVYSRAGGVHIEPSTAGFLVRYRIGEILHEAMRLPEQAGKLLVEQLKSAAKLFPVAAAQTGHFKVVHDNETHVVHVSTMPIHKGEKLVMRLTKEEVGEKGSGLEELGFHGSGLEAFHKVLRAKSGLIVVAGAELRKKTLLHSFLRLLNTPHLALASVEEEVTEHIPHVAQVSTKNSKLSAATLLRTTLRHDPDVVMVAPIVDAEVALMAVEAAGQGKLVIVGVEASSAAEGIEELLRFGVSPLSLAASLRAVVAVGEARKLCPHCKTTHRLSRTESGILEEQGVDFGRVFGALKEEGVVDRNSSWKDIDFYWPEGCNKCEGGYKGVLGTGEILLISGHIKELIMQGAPGVSIEGQARVEGMLSLKEDWLYKAAMGETGVEEILGSVKRPN